MRNRIQRLRKRIAVLIKASHRKLLLRWLRPLIGLIGLVLFIVLWSLGRRGNPNSITTALYINLAAGALTIAFTAFLIDWLSEQRHKASVYQPLRSAKHELASVKFMLSNCLGKPYITDSYFGAVSKYITSPSDNEYGNFNAFSEAVLGSLASAKRESLPATTAQMATDLTRQLSSQIKTIDEILTLYGFALDTELRDKVHLLRDRLVSLRNSTDLASTMTRTQELEGIQVLVGLSILSVADAAEQIKVGWIAPEA